MSAVPTAASASPPPSAVPATRLWRQAAFRSLLLAHLTSNLGDWLAFLALFGIVALERQSGVAGIGALAVAFMLPLVVVAPIAGVFVDRWDLRRIMVVSDLLRAGVVLAMTVQPGTAWLCVLLFVHQSIGCFFNPAQHAAIPRLVPPGDILRANAMTAQAAHLTKVLGPAIGGALVALLGVRGCFIVDAFTFAASAAWLVRLPALPKITAEAPPGKARHDLRVGLHFLWTAPRLRVLTLGLAACIAGLGSVIPSLPVHARDALRLQSVGIGLLLSGVGAGMLIGSTWLARTPVHVDRLMLMGIAAVASGLGLLGVAACTGALLAFMTIVLVGAGLSVLLVAAHTMVQEETPPPLRGRVVSFILAGLGAAQVAGMGFASRAAVAHPAAFTLSVAGGVLAVCGAALCLAAFRWRARPARPGVASTRVGSPR